MIVGTAGHIDHGKTTLVRALTGVDTDRLPEEKARGMSIELGYAFMEIPPDVSGASGSARAAERIGFIDVPGHDRLVHTMISGATGIDFALILVAADDGVMPQTREHVAVLSLLGLARGAVAITKIDRVEPARVVAVRAEVEALLAGTPLAGVPALPVAATTGDGVDALRALLVEAARNARARADDGRGFRLAIDRVFTLTGTGVVVTGTAHAGVVKVGDELALAPSAVDLRVRVRSLRAQDRTVDEAHAGERCAMGLSGVAKDQLERGQWLVSPAIGVSTDRLDVALATWRGEAKALRSGALVHVHLGARDVMGTVAVLRADARDAGDALAPGAGGIVQLVLRKPVGAWHGDRLVLRDASASRAIAGGRVLDPFAPARYRRSAQRWAELAAWSAPDPAARLRGLQDAATFGVSLRRWAQAEGLADLPDAASAAHGDWLLGAARREAFADAAIAALRSFHSREPGMLGPDAARLRRVAAPRLPEPVWAAVLAGLVADGRVAQRGAFVHLPAHGLELSAIDRRIAQKIAPALAAGGFEGVWARDLAKDTRESEAVMRTTLARLAQRGDVHQVVADLCYAPQVIARLATLARTLARDDDADSVTVARFRDATGLGRKRAVQLLEYFDRIGLLRRVGDRHRLRADSTLYTGATEA